MNDRAIRLSSGLAEMFWHNLQGERWFITIVAQLTDFEDEWIEALIDLSRKHEKLLKKMGCLKE